MRSELGQFEVGATCQRSLAVVAMITADANMLDTTEVWEHYLNDQRSSVSS